MTTRAFVRRAFLVAAVLLGATAALGFSQSASDANPGHPSEPGVLVVSVEPGSPAEKAGVVRGDIITDVNGAAVNSQADIRQAIASHKQGDTLSVKVRHGDENKTLSVALGEKNGRPYMGLLLFPEGQGRLGMRRGNEQGWPWATSQGAIVARVASGGPADKAGIKKGDVILSVDGVQVDTDHGLSALIQDKKVGDTVTLSVKARTEPADKAPRDLKVTLGSTPDKKRPWLGVEYRQGFPAAFMPWSDFPPAARLLTPDFGQPLNMPAMPEGPSAPGLRRPDAPAPMV